MRKQAKDFDTELVLIAKDISNLSDTFLKLSNLKSELESVTSKKGIFNLKILLMAFGNLKKRMQKFEDAMTKKEDEIIQDILEDVKQLN